MTATPFSTDGTVEVVDGRFVLRFERRFRHPIEKVWDALTRPERIKEWLGEVEVDLELVEGGRYYVETVGPPELVEAIKEEAGADQLVAHDTVLRVERPMLFVHTFGGDPASIARWELQRDGDGCRLTLIHTEPPDFDPAHRARDLGGWHTLLDLMEASLDGQPIPWTKQRWEQHRDRYVKESS